MQQWHNNYTAVWSWVPSAVIELTPVSIQIGAITELAIDALACHSTCTQMALICWEKAFLMDYINGLWFGKFFASATNMQAASASVQLHREERNCMARKLLNKAPLFEQCFHHCSHSQVLYKPIQLFMSPLSQFLLMCYCDCHRTVLRSP